MHYWGPQYNDTCYKLPTEGHHRKYWHLSFVIFYLHQRIACVAVDDPPCIAIQCPVDPMSKETRPLLDLTKNGIQENESPVNYLMKETKQSRVVCGIQSKGILSGIKLAEIDAAVSILSDVCLLLLDAGVQTQYWRGLGRLQPSYEQLYRKIWKERSFPVDFSFKKTEGAECGWAQEQGGIYLGGCQWCHFSNWHAADQSFYWREV